MIDRYECGEERLVMDLNPQGEWVRYDEAQARIAQLQAALIIAATPDNAYIRMDEMEAADPNPDDGFIEVGK
tara:strand:+ start:4975 stop:5190 length:216 start_codon:yes stop_codon:yes gene_type:complete